LPNLTSPRHSPPLVPSHSIRAGEGKQQTPTAAAALLPAPIKQNRASQNGSGSCSQPLITTLDRIYINKASAAGKSENVHQHAVGKKPLVLTSALPPL